MSRSEKGASMLEYALMAALVAVVAIVAVSSLGGQVGEEFNTVDNALNPTPAALPTRRPIPVRTNPPIRRP